MYCTYVFWLPLRQEVDDEADKNATTNINFLHWFKFVGIYSVENKVNNSFKFKTKKINKKIKTKSIYKQSKHILYSIYIYIKNTESAMIIMHAGQINCVLWYELIYKTKKKPLTKRQQNWFAFNATDDDV